MSWPAHKVLVLNALYGPRREKTCLRVLVNNKSAGLSSGVCEQQKRKPACTFVQSDQRLCYLLTGKYLTLPQAKFLVSVAEGTSLSQALSEPPKTGFVASRPI